MLKNTWNNILEWFNDRKKRSKLVRDFNKSAREAFICGTDSTLLKVYISKGEKSYSHQYTKYRGSGFRIQTFSNRALSKEEIIEIGEVIISDKVFVRQLVVLGWDTLEVHDNTRNYKYQWQLKEHLQ